jgi:hypothetical protein
LQSEKFLLFPNLIVPVGITIVVIVVKVVYTLATPTQSNRFPLSRRDNLLQYPVGLVVVVVFGPVVVVVVVLAIVAAAALSYL